MPNDSYNKKRRLYCKKKARRRRESLRMQRAQDTWPPRETVVRASSKRLISALAPRVERRKAG